MRVFLAVQFTAAVLAIVILSGCSFHVGFDYNGKTGIDNQTISPELREVKGAKY